MNAKIDSISTELVKIKLTVKQWSKSQKDKDSQQRAAARYNADADMMTAGLRLLKPEDIKPVEKAIGRLRNTYRNLTRPWGDDSWRVYACKDHFDINRELNQLVREVEKEIAQLVKRWPEIVSNARNALGAAAAQVEYPSARAIGEYFTVNIEREPLADSSDLRINLSKTEKAKIERAIRTATHAKLAEVARESLKLIAQQLKTIVKNLTPETDKDKARGHRTFRDSMISNLRAQVKTSQRLNVANDPQVQEICDEIDKTLAKYTVEDLREDKDARKESKDAAKKILQKMQGYTK